MTNSACYNFAWPTPGLFSLTRLPRSKRPVQTIRLSVATPSSEVHVIKRGITAHSNRLASTATVWNRSSSYMLRLWQFVQKGERSKSPFNPQRTLSTDNDAAITGLWDLSGAHGWYTAKFGTSGGTPDSHAHHSVPRSMSLTVLQNLHRRTPEHNSLAYRLAISAWMLDFLNPALTLMAALSPYQWLQHQTQHKHPVTSPHMTLTNSRSFSMMGNFLASITLCTLGDAYPAGSTLRPGNDTLLIMMMSN